MKHHPLAGCYEQTEWAKAATNKIQSDIQEFISSNPYRTVANVDPERGEEIYRFEVSDVPRHLRIEIGHIIASLRDPLDNVLAILSHRKRGADDKVGFPFGKSEKAHSDAIKAVEKLLPDGAVELIQKADTQPGGNAHLRALHELSIHKKHRLPVAPFNVRCSFSMGSLIVTRGHVFRVGFRNGQHLKNGLPLLGSGPLRQGTQALAPRYFDGRLAFEPAPGDDEMEFLSAVPGTQFHADIKPTIDIAFTKSAGIEREPVTIALHQMRQLVDGILLAFEKRFFA